jgi:hypothetical protein
MVFEHASESLAPDDWVVKFADGDDGLQQPVAETLMISLAVIMAEVLCNPDALSHRALASVNQKQLEALIARAATCSSGELAQLWSAHLRGRCPGNALVRRQGFAWRLQAQAQGGLPDRTKAPTAGTRISIRRRCGPSAEPVDGPQARYPIRALLERSIPHRSSNSNRVSLHRDRISKPL